ncbi:MAG: NUDIX domain-containing protein [Anaerolineales bacterium]|nr:MAG: NUDIX domain-containing protein [Anaerolineales bacterium]
MAKTSAGILMYRVLTSGKLEVLLVHPGGPYWRNKDLGAWSIPKGEYTDEDPLAAARREFREETSFEVEGEFIALQPVIQKGGKQVSAWAVEGNIDADAARSIEFEMEWPPRSGRMASFPEVERAAWFPLREALVKLNPAQTSFVRQLADTLGIGLE